MHALVKISVFLLVASLELLNPALVAARRLVSNGFLTVDLVHRESPLSPYYNSSMSPQAQRERAGRGSVSLGHHIRLSSAYYDIKDVNTDLVPNGGDYVIKFSIGTPPTEFYADADTGSDLIWLQCSPCQSCIKQQSPLFDLTKSSTYQKIPCSSQSCYYPDVASGCPVNSLNNDSSSCVYEVSYGDTTSSFGNLATDTISFPSTASATFPSSILGCGFDQSGTGFGQSDGILGLGSGPLSLVSQLGAKINYKFSYCLTPLSSMVNSKLKFGVDVTGQGVVSTPFMTGNPPTYYNVMLDGINVANSSIPVAQNIIIDSGTTYTYLHDEVYAGIRAAMVDAIGLKPVQDPPGYTDLCYETPQSGQGFNPPDVVFQFTGADVVLKATNTFRTVGSLTCLAIRPVAANNIMVFGNIAQVNFEVGYDLQAKLVSFAPADCSQQ